jgi:hypothetical protein
MSGNWTRHYCRGPLSNTAAGALPANRNRQQAWEERVATNTRTHIFAAAATAVIAGLAAWTMPSADAQQRKSLRWATASVDT